MTATDYLTPTLTSDEVDAILLVCGVIKAPVNLRKKIPEKIPDVRLVPAIQLPRVEPPKVPKVPKPPKVVSPEERRAYRLNRQYSITVEQYDAILASQGGHCAICPATKKLGVDHDHGCCPGHRSCGRCIRGILCGACNTMLGHARDRPEALAAGIAYLARPHGVPYRTSLPIPVGF